MNIDNCPRCGRLYAINFREVCPSCIKEIDTEYSLCAEYLRKNKGATITELSEETEVSVKQITKFIREGRISLMHAPNLSYPCEVCGTLIRDSNMCNNCRSRLVNDVKAAMQDRLVGNNESGPKAGYKIGERLRDHLE